MSIFLDNSLVNFINLGQISIGDNVNTKYGCGKVLDILEENEKGKYPLAIIEIFNNVGGVQLRLNELEIDN